MKKKAFVVLTTVFILWGCSPVQKDMEARSPVTISEDFAGDSDILIQHQSWVSREADFFLEDGVWKLKASGTRISETWKTYKDTLPPDLDWSISLEVTVPNYWDTMDTEEAQVGAGVFVGKVDPDQKSRTVYETNLAAIAQGVRFVQGQLIKNRLGDDPIAVGVMGFAENTDITDFFPYIDNFKIVLGEK